MTLRRERERTAEERSTPVEPRIVMGRRDWQGTGDSAGASGILRDISVFFPPLIL